MWIWGKILDKTCPRSFLQMSADRGMDIYREDQIGLIEDIPLLWGLLFSFVGSSPLFCRAFSVKAGRLLSRPPSIDVPRLYLFSNQCVAKPANLNRTFHPSHISKTPFPPSWKKPSKQLRVVVVSRDRISRNSASNIDCEDYTSSSKRRTTLVSGWFIKMVYS